MKLKILIATLFLGLSLTPAMPILKAQDKIEVTENDYTNDEVEMADQFRAEGKIYVVVATVLSILLGIFTYLVYIERKVSKLEKLANH